jgi:molybdopterin converting factor subunit 1
MQIEVLAFGIARDILGGSSTTLEVAGDLTVAELQARLVAAYPAFAGLASLAIAVNEEYAEPQHTIRPGDEVVIIPPVAGG